MRFRITSVTSEETGALFREITVKFEDWLNAALGDSEFGEGVDQFTIIFISVDDQKDQNTRWASAHNKLGKYKDRFSGESVRYLSVAVEILPSEILGKSPLEYFSCAAVAAINCLKIRHKRIPKGFDYLRCATSISKALDVYAKTMA
jgi:hypothetical protein